MLLPVVMLMIIGWYFKRTKRNVIFIVGDRGAGKTELLYSVTDGVTGKKCPSAKNNETSIVLKGRAYKLVDVAGQRFLKAEFLKKLDLAKGVILVVDSENSQKAASSADWLYSILIQKAYQRSKPSLTVLLNSKSGHSLSANSYL